jgi:hypothetical protein
MPGFAASHACPTADVRHGVVTRATAAGSGNVAPILCLLGGADILNNC